MALFLTALLPDDRKSQTISGIQMNKYIAVLLSVALFLIPMSTRHADAQDASPTFKIRADLAPEYRMFIPDQLKLEDIDDFGMPPDSQGNKETNNYQKKYRFSVGVSRLVTGGEKVDPFLDDKISKWNMLKSLPGDFAGAQSYQDRLEIVGKIFEPKVTLDIEF